MINLKTQFGKKYKVTFDQATATADREGFGIEAKTIDEYYFQIPCKFHKGFITALTDGRLSLYSESAQALNNIVRKYGDKVQSFIGDSDGFIYFPLELAEEIFKTAGARQKRQVSEEEKSRLKEMGKKYLFKKT